MENPVEIIIEEFRKAIHEEADRIIDVLRPEPEVPGIKLTDFISLKKAAEELGIASQTLWNHRKDIGYTKQFGQIFFLRADILRYLESGRPVVEKKGIMYMKYTRRKSGD